MYIIFNEQHNFVENYEKEFKLFENLSITTLFITGFSHEIISTIESIINYKYEVIKIPNGLHFWHCYDLDQI